MTEKTCTRCSKTLDHRNQSGFCKAHRPGPAPYYGLRPYRAPRTPDVRDTPRYEVES